MRKFDTLHQFTEHYGADYCGIFGRIVETVVRKELRKAETQYSVTMADRYHDLETGSYRNNTRIKYEIKTGSGTLVYGYYEKEDAEKALESGEWLQHFKADKVIYIREECRDCDIINMAYVYDYADFINALFELNRKFHLVKKRGCKNGAYTWNINMPQVNTAGKSGVKFDAILATKARMTVAEYARSIGRGK